MPGTRSTTTSSATVATEEAFARTTLDGPHHKSVLTLTGTIARRRILGRCLAFADISLDTSAGANNTAPTIVPVVFRRQLVVTNDFPVKKAALPYGARVELTCLLSNRDVGVGSGSGEGADHTRTQQPHLLEVTHWKLLTNPHEQALATAMTTTTTTTTTADDSGGGISCTDYLRSRREDFDNVTTTLHRQQESQSQQQSTKRKKPIIVIRSPDDDAVEEQAAESAAHDNGNRRTKALRATIFASWIMENILRQDGSDRVLDVAGGKGQLSMELSAAAGHDVDVRCTVVDPVQRKRPPAAAIKQLVKQGKSVPEFVARYFVNDGVPSLHDFELVRRHTCLVGLHPDQCTEAILDVALQQNKSVAIVPCCVFPSLFPIRMLTTMNTNDDGSEQKPVRSYQDFLLFLLQKDPRLRQVTLPFEGKNECIYLKV